MYKLPTVLIESEEYKNLNPSGKILYSLLLNRMEKEPKIDEEGKTYCVYKQTDLMDITGWHIVTVKNNFKLLQAYGLIEEYKRVSFKEGTSRIYLKIID